MLHGVEHLNIVVHHRLVIRLGRNGIRLRHWTLESRLNSAIELLRSHRRITRCCRNPRWPRCWGKVGSICRARIETFRIVTACKCNKMARWALTFRTMATRPPFLPSHQPAFKGAQFFDNRMWRMEALVELSGLAGIKMTLCTRVTTFELIGPE